jgi:hypothetical protein
MNASWNVLLLAVPDSCALGAVGALAAVHPHPKLALETERVALENARVRVVEYRSRPTGNVCGVGEHTHPAHVTIVLSPARDRAAAVGGKTEIGDMKVGDVYWSDGETHTDVNIGKTNSRVIVVELK